VPQIFHRSTNTLARVSLFGAVFLLAAVVWAAYAINSSPYVTQAFKPREQPVQFSHKHHVGDDGIDCRYCHTTVEKSAFAGIPPTKTCMNCHSQLFLNSPYLEIVRASWRNQQPLEWTRVHDLPDFVYFNHSIHVTKGIGCSTCHGRVDQMPLMYQVASLQMEWCLNCHRRPDPYLRPRDQIYNMAWQAPPNQAEQARRLRAEYKIQDEYALTRCSICHR
jgi:hypothetical protein